MRRLDPSGGDGGAILLLSMFGCGVVRTKRRWYGSEKDVVPL